MTGSLTTRVLRTIAAIEEARTTVREAGAPPHASRGGRPA